jgi:mRNA interferase MazF
VNPGDLVIAAFPGAHLTKTRPAVVLSTPEYHLHRPDVVLGLITSRDAGPLSPTDSEIIHWARAGLHARSRFRLYIVTLNRREVRFIGRLAEEDWRNVIACFDSGLIGPSRNRTALPNVF